MGQTPQRLKSPNSRFLFIWVHAEIFALTACCLSSFFAARPTQPPSVKVNNCDSGYSRSSPTWIPTPCFWLGLSERVVFFLLKAVRQGHGGKVNWLERYFCWLDPSLTVTIISVISASATDFWLHPGTAERPPYFTCSQLHYLIGYMQIGPKLKATCEGSPLGMVLAHKHARTNWHGSMFLSAVFSVVFF